MENRPEGVPDIPVLRKENKEKKRGLGWLFRGSPSGSSAVAAAGARQAGGGLLAALSGKVAVAALALGVGGAGLVGYGYLSKGQASASKSPNLSPIASGMQIQKRNADGSRSLSYLADASKGEVKWDDPAMANAAGPKGGAAGADADAAKEGGADAKAEGAMPDVGAMMAGAGAGAGGMGGLSGAKLSQGTSGSSAFGSKSIFSGGSNSMRAPGAKPGAGQMALGRTATGNLSMKRGGERASARALSTRGAKSSRAMGQLKFSDRLSAQAKGAGGEQSSQYATDAFEQGKTQGGSIDGPGGAGMGDTPMVMGGGGESPSGSGSGYTQPDPGAGQNVTPYQGMVDGAQGMSNIAIMLYLIAVVLLAIAYYIWGMVPYGTAIAIVLIILALALIAMGVMMSDMAGNMGDTVSDAYGQKEQGEIIKDDADAAKGGKHGTYQGDVKTRGTVQTDVGKERNATYQE
ncbi:MAG: hypothetical protein WC969_06845 [Elusimicrobiota bacterium]|jgi:hypothetical protein